MSWTEKLVTLATGKNKEERTQEKVLTGEIRKKQNAAYFQAKEKEEIRVAQTRARLEADAKVRSMQRRYNPPKQNYSSPFGSGFGGGMNPITGASLTPKPQYRPRPKSSGRRIVYVERRTVKRSRPRPRQPRQDNYKPYSIWG